MPKIPNLKGAIAANMRRKALESLVETHAKSVKAKAQDSSAETIGAGFGSGSINIPHGGGYVAILITQIYNDAKDTIQLQAELINPINNEWSARGSGFAKKVIKTKVGKYTGGVKESEQVAELLSLVSDFLVKEAKKVEKSGENSIFE